MGKNVSWPFAALRAAPAYILLSRALLRVVVHKPHWAPGLDEVSSIEILQLPSFSRPASKSAILKTAEGNVIESPIVTLNSPCLGEWLV